MDQLYEQEAESFQTLGHPIRLRLLSLLTESGRCACELQPELEVEVDQSTIARHLLALKRAGSAGEEGRGVGDL